jgi:HEAT repeat protein
MSQQESLEALLDQFSVSEAPLRAALIYRLSDPSAEDLAAFKASWSDILVDRRQLLLSRLVETSEASFDVDFTAVALFTLDDDDQVVRQHAIDLLWENMEPTIMRQIIRMMQMDESPDVRAAAAQSLGRFVLAGELGEIREAVGREASNALLEVCLAGDEPPEVLRRALESVSYASHDEVDSLIEEASQHTDVRMRASAILAMGRSADRRWDSDVRDALFDDEPEIRFEAARAVGELGMTSAVPRLIEMLDEDDREIQEMVIWSLGEIGGDEAQRALLRLTSREDLDEDLLEAIEDAINMAMLGAGHFVAYLFNPDDDGPNDGFEDLDDFDDDEVLDDLDDMD